jgi:hypothetical protein
MIRNWCVLLLIAFALAACGRGGAATLNEPIQLAPGEWAHFAAEDLELEFVGIAEDSRCPNDATCVWAGQVVVQLTLRRNNRNKEVLAKDSKAVAVDGYTISILQVLPARASSGPLPPADYRVTLKITR